MSALNMHAPLNLLRIRGYYLKSRPSATIPTRNPELQLHSWMASKCSRIAVWNAAQIARIVSRETEHPNSNKRLVLNPLAIPGLLMSAAVVLVYAFYSRVCPVCTGGEPLDLVHLFGAEDDCERLVRWKETGSGLASWGPSLFNGTQVCQCMVDKLANWFRGLLSRDTKAEARLIAFLAELKGAL
ncbi:hypothetical protein F5B20DRAFT_397555 [Whalleya microplaca]|nr:hypothetical protein F5B20DRAFT_397555 [Whalleya microplaca]